MAGTVLIVDDQPAFRRMARVLLTAAGWDVVGEAGDADSAVSAAERLRPGLVLLDVNLPGEDGVTVAWRLSCTSRPPAVVLTSGREAADFGPRLHEAPARGFLPKDELSGPALSALLA